MTRIIAGRARGRRLAVPPRGTRPTSDRVRESLFSALDSQLADAGLSWAGVSVLDLFAGSGALGLEAISRGAASAVLVEKSPAAARVLDANVAAVSLPGVKVVVRDVGRLAAAAPRVTATLVLVDPPYEIPAADVRTLLADLRAGGWIAADAIVVVERSTRDVDPPLPAGWSDQRQRAFGDTTLWYGRASSDEDAAGEEA